MRRKEANFAANRAQQPQKGRNPGVWRHRKKAHGEEGSEHAWAVSYVDLLMVLMSFFIMFFSLEPGQKREDVLMKLTSTFQKSGAPKVEKSGIDLGGKDTGTNVPVMTPGVAITNLTALLKRAQTIKVAQSPLDPRGIVIDLPDDIFPPAGFRPTPRLVMELGGVFKILKTMQKDVRLVFVGHTDDIPVIARNRKNIIASNLVLSDLRASYAAGLAVENGFEPIQISTQGFAEFARGTRSVSVHVLEKLVLNLTPPTATPPPTESGKHSPAEAGKHAPAEPAKQAPAEPAKQAPAEAAKHH